METSLWRIISASWARGDFHNIWKRDLIALAYKKDLNKDPSHFRPITLQPFRPITLKPVLSKFFTSIFRNRKSDFCYKNKYIESNLQKGFWDYFSDCKEHIETLTHIINHTQKKQRSLVITLLDLKNALGEVSHGLLLSVLKYHHIPDHIIDLAKSLYTSYQLAIATNSYVTSRITVRRVLQGDSLSPLLFNLVINTLIHAIKQDKMSSMCYVYDGTLAPKYRMQFADATALVTSLESDNKYLCQAFVKWSTWAGLFIKVSKCHVFGVRKVKTDIILYKPYITINKTPIPTVKISENFT